MVFLSSLRGKLFFLFLFALFIGQAQSQLQFEEEECERGWEGENCLLFDQQVVPEKEYSTYVPSGRWKIFPVEVTSFILFFFFFSFLFFLFFFFFEKEKNDLFCCLSLLLVLSLFSLNINHLFLFCFSGLLSVIATVTQASSDAAVCDVDIYVQKSGYPNRARFFFLFF